MCCWLCVKLFFPLICWICELNMDKATAQRIVLDTFKALFDQGRYTAILLMAQKRTI